MKSTCLRCGIEIDESEGGTDAAGNRYCESCFDEMFVSWNDVQRGKFDSRPPTVDDVLIWGEKH